MKKKTKQFAFWRYDLFPYVIGAEITEIRDDGRIMAMGYDGYLFRPIKILPYDEGQEIDTKLEQLKNDRANYLELTEELFKGQLEKIFPLALTK